jgi:hypothetical protein
MKLLRVACFVTILLVLVRDASGQGFVNFDFEGANLPIFPAPASPTQVSFTDAFPGWTGYIGTSQATLAFDNGISAGSAAMSLITPNTGNFGLSNRVVGGFYTAILSSGSNPQNISQIIPAALAQTGPVPVGTESLIFKLGSSSQFEGFSVTFNGQNLVLVPLLAGPNYEMYGADVSAFAGTTGELRFTEAPTSSLFNHAFLDDIQFSAQVVPEPNILSLCGLCTFLLLWQRRSGLTIYCSQRRRVLSVPQSRLISWARRG